MMTMLTRNGNYLENPAATKDTLEDYVSSEFNAWKQEIGHWLSELWADTLIFIDKMSFWVACIGSIYNIWLYAATHDRKYSKRITVLFLTYIFIQMIVSVMEK